jgi:hypothetical protein
MTTKHMVKKFTYRRHFEIFPGTLYHLIRMFLSLALRPPFSSPEPFSLGHSLKIRLWFTRPNGKI